MSLERFKIAQADAAAGFHETLAELRKGRKVSHWIWYIFPQLRGLGRSPTAQFYALEDAGEARRYFQDPELRQHLLIVMQVVADQLTSGTQLDDLMGSTTDSAKVVSCMTLFREIAKEGDASTEIGDISEISQKILDEAERQGYPECSYTLRSLEQP